MRQSFSRFSRLIRTRNPPKFLTSGTAFLRRSSFASQQISFNFQQFTRFSSSIPSLKPVSESDSTMSETILDKKILSQYVLPLDQPVVNLDCDVAFNSLTNQEKLYAHYLSQASWYGGLIVTVQTSPESPVIFSLLLDLFKSNGIENLKTIAVNQCNFTEDEWTALLVYANGIFAQSGNYKGFGDTKIIPGLPLDKFESLINVAKFNGLTETDAKFKWDSTKNLIYSLSERERQLGLGEKGITTYFSENCTQDDAELITRFMTSQKLDAYITRVFKTVNGAVPDYEIRSASALPDDNLEKKVYKFEGANITLTRGDYGPLLEEVCKYLTIAKDYASNDTEKFMLDSYVKSFREGSLDAHKEGSRYWIKNKSPAIETYIGFIETYRDPAGTKGEFEGFVSIVNRPMSEKFQELVNRAKSILPLLPWPEEFEKDTFLKPDFTSLDVLTFSGSGIPAGINIPNYDEIRQNEGFKNVSLGNVIPASYKFDSKVPFLSAEDKELMNKYRVEAFEVQVGLHELLGHGSGKVFTKSENGTTNFGADVKNPVTGTIIETTYEHGETYDSVFTTMGSAYEECRAECVGIYLSLDNDVLKIFGHEGEEAETIKYVNWLSMVYAGAAKALEMYQPQTNAWLQAHSQARFVILQVLLEAGEGFVTIEEKIGEDGKPDLLISMDKTKIDKVGRKAIHDFLLKLQVYKTTADIKQARAMFERYSAVHNDGKYPWASWREIIMDKKQPRKMFVQHNTTVADDSSVLIKSYEGSHAGLIQSWVERFKDDVVFQGLDYCWKKDKPFF